MINTVLITGQQFLIIGAFLITGHQFFLFKAANVSIFTVENVPLNSRGV